ncbi:hypothetical protein AB0K09_10715 [Streptomyces sp. NPDC049577]|uniref:hypothetical protein n=1 Tax=Streptomyces sp. NPDC049577 TaxID=3155153 RepID=UPI0034336F0E
MTGRLRRALTVLCAAAALSVAGAGSAGAHPTGQKPTVLDLYLSKQSLLHFHQALHAHLADDRGNPVSGAYIRMYTPGHAKLCQTVTDAHGDANCDAPLAAPTEVVNETLNGYYARFDGDDHHLPAEAHAPSTLVAGDI